MKMSQVDHENNKKSMKLPLFLIIGPSLGVVGAIILYAIINFVVSSFAAGDVNATQGGDLFGDNGIFKTIANVLLFLLGALSILSFFPCLIIGIILLSKRRSVQNEQEALDERSWKDLE
jgi:ABC-type sugar transport system permease subunit